MRAFILAALIIMATPALADARASAPKTPAPPATASFEAREMWCTRYATWLIAQTPMQGSLPSDVRPTHRFEIELDSCKPDPQRYQRQTSAELQQARVRATRY